MKQSQSSKKRSSKRTVVGGLAHRTSGDPVKRIIVYVPAEDCKRLRVRCAEEERTLSDAVSEAISTWLASSGRK